METKPAPDTRQSERAARVAARAFVVAGGVFWMVAAFAGPYAYGGMTLTSSMATASWPFLATVVTLIIGWSNERLAAVLLLAATSAVLVWGVLYEWEFGVWAIMSFVLVLPMFLAAALFLLSARSEERRSLAARAVRPPANAVAGVGHRAETPVRPRSW